MSPAPRRSPAGDLTITVQVEPHPYFKREGQNLQVEVPITVGEAVLGAKIDVPALEGMKSLTVPPGSSTGQRLRIKGQGIPASGGKPQGDLFVSLKVVVPKTTDATSKPLDPGILRTQPAESARGVVVTIPRSTAIISGRSRPGATAFSMIDGDGKTSERPGPANG